MNHFQTDGKLLLTYIMQNTFNLQTLGSTTELSYILGQYYACVAKVKEIFVVFNCSNYVLNQSVHFFKYYFNSMPLSL